MYIKRLEIVGFKSFPERVLVPLSPGISAVVGPNGCGKSNIIDAIRWVMGEQSPKMLRGRNMDDVLFNGSQNKPGSALAEVTLTLARDADPERGFPAAAETSVTRRLYRSGDSEYLVNKVPCRLKDVVHFFTDHGVGTRAYGIIEQGRVGWLVDARPEERRGLIDEAAGITRYKQQKKEAERKIESAEANLVNVSVIKAETKKQLDQITRAAAKAARYKALKEELRELDLGLSARDLTAGRAKRRELSESREENRRLLVSLLAEADRHELEMENIKLAVARSEKDLEEKNTAWHQLVAARDGLVKEAEFTRSNQVRSGEMRVRVLDDLAKISSERRRKLEEESRLTEDLADLEREDQEARAHTENLREQWRAMKAAFDALSREHDQAARLRTESDKKAASLTAQLAGAESLLSHHRNRLETLAEEALAAAEAALAAETRLAELTARKEDFHETLAASEDQVAYQAEAVALAERDGAAAAARVIGAESRLAGLTAKLETLRDVKDNFGWYPQGVKALMAAPELRAAGLIGPLAESLTIPDGYEAAAEAALGERLAWLLVESRGAALTALDYLDRNNLGRCGFICRDELGADLSKALLGDFRLAEDLLAAAEVAPRLGPCSDPAEAPSGEFGRAGAESPNSRPSILTRNGRYAGGGLVAGGRPGEGRGAADAGLLARLKEVEEIEGRVGDLEAELAALRADQARSIEVLAESREAARVAESARAAAARQLAETEKAIILSGSEANQARAQHKSLQAEKDKTEAEAAQLTVSLAEGREQRRAAEEAATAAASKVEELKAALAERSEELEELRAGGEEARLAAASAAERLDRTRHDLSLTTQWLEEVEDNLAAKEAEAAALAEELERLAERAAELEERAAAFPGLLKAAEEELTGVRSRLEEERRRQASRESEAREVRRRREDLSSIINGQETDLMAVKFKLDKLEEDLRRDWRLVMFDPDELPPPEEVAPQAPGDDEAPAVENQGEVDDEAADVENQGEADGEAADVENEGRPVKEAADAENQDEAEGEDEVKVETPPAFEAVDPREWIVVELPADAASRRESLRTKIGSLGEVSLGAIEREAELRAEYDRYQSQYDDLTKAIADLKDSINKINYTCRLRFAETFQAVDVKFREIFPILFEGGEGWISLTDENDPLESGVEIHVHPPGKKVLVMSLLSGGEKALTALALIFALYLIKPSPFCLLDETDAPLDEANIDRFNRLLRNLSRASQIIMVTHNKRTMQISHTLYGVTMETPGVSKLVSVNLAEAEALTADV